MTIRGVSKSMVGVCVLVAGCVAMTSSAYASFGFKSVQTSFNQAPPAGAEPGTPGPPDFQAGSHPYQLTTNFTFNTTSEEHLEGSVKDLRIELPPGLVGNPSAVPRCPMAVFAGSQELIGGNCPADTQIGTFSIVGVLPIPIYNLVPPPGVASRFGVLVFTPVFMDATVRNGSDYGLNVEMPDLPQGIPLPNVSVNLWGVPAVSGHDELRGQCARGGGSCPSDAPAEPFLTLPTYCSQPLTTTVLADSWQEPGVFVEKSTTTDASDGAPGGLSGCDSLYFNPTIAVQPESSATDSPTGLSLDTSIPYNSDPEGLAEANPESISMALPAGLSINPATAAGLTGCSPAQFGIGQTAKPECPNASKIGALEIETPILAGILQGSIYLAQPAAGTFSGVVGVYLAGEKDGLLVKLSGQLDAQPGSGQLTFTLSNVPDLPFTAMKLLLYGGPRATVATPPGCGVYTATATMTPYSAPESGAPATASSSFAINEGCSGGFAPSFAAGATSSAAGQSTGFTLQLARGDGQQYIQSLDTTLPAGLVANLSTIVQCGEAEAAAGTCPASSEIGTVTIGAGAGADPYYLTGRVYLTGPYGGAPYGMAMVIPGAAGPFDLGLVVVRGSIAVDFAAARMTIATDSLPASLQGVPLRVKNLSLDIDRPGFMIDPTECAAEQITGFVDSAEGARASISAPFQVVGCSRLPFAPKVTASAEEPASRKRGVGLDLEVAYPTGPEANMRSIVVELPRVLRARLATIHQACTAAVFAANPARCPAGALVGSGTVKTTILPTPLSGPVYLVAGSGLFPHMAMVLQGDGLALELDGTIQILKGGITSTTFEGIPDAPISAMKISLPRGPHSMLGSTTNMCTHKPTIGYAITGYNGVRVKSATKLAVLSGCGDGHLAGHSGSGRHGKR